MTEAAVVVLCWVLCNLYEEVNVALSQVVTPIAIQWNTFIEATEDSGPRGCLSWRIE